VRLPIHRGGLFLDEKCAIDGRLMNQSLLYRAFGVREGYECVRTDYEHGAVQFHLAVKADRLICPGCQSTQVIRKGGRERSLQTVPIGLKPVFLVTEVPKCECKDCGAKFEIPPFLPRPMCITPKSSRPLSTP
jgi:hypothetical protein